MVLERSSFYLCMYPSIFPSLELIISLIKLILSLRDSTKKGFVLLCKAASLPIAESSIIAVSDGRIPNSSIVFQYISGMFGKPSLTCMKSK